jgi:hypothetical protein
MNCRVWLPSPWIVIGCPQQLADEDGVTVSPGRVAERDAEPHDRGPVERW